MSNKKKLYMAKNYNDLIFLATSTGLYLWKFKSDESIYILINYLILVFKIFKCLFVRQIYIYSDYNTLIIISGYLLYTILFILNRNKKRN